MSGAVWWLAGIAATGWTAWGVQFAAYRRLRRRGYRRAAEMMGRREAPPQGPPGWMTTRQLEELSERNRRAYERERDVQEWRGWPT